MFNLRKLLPFYNADGGTSGAVENESENADGEAKGADEPKTGDDVKSEAQKIADAMVAKKLKNMPSKEELAEFKKWQNEQKTEDEKLIEAQREIEAAKAEIATKEIKASAMIEAINAGIKTQFIEDAVILAAAKVTDEVTIEEAMHQVAKNNPSWTMATGLQGYGGNPVEKKTQDKRTVAEEIYAKLYGEK